MTDPAPTDQPARLTSLDAYRGFVMLAMVSGGFALASTLKRSPDIAAQFDGTSFETVWQTLWALLAYQFDHVEWTGCAFWDLIQPSFMFMVGVAMPFSYSRRAIEGQSPRQRLAHVMFRSLVLVLLGIFLSSNWSSQTNFTFVNVLTQIGLGYTFVYLLLNRPAWMQLAAALLVLGGYWFYFYQYTIPSSEYEALRAYLAERHDLDPDKELHQFDGLAVHWNKHTNAAAAADRSFLNVFPRAEEPWRNRSFWANRGGYQTLNFVPSIATMIFGLMAGQLLRSSRSDRRKLYWMLGAGTACFALSMAVDTTIWPIAVEGCNWSLCPIVKRIWTPTWTIFSTGWTLWFLAAFYWIIDIKGYRRWAFPLTVVGLNSIAMYCMAQLIKPWTGKTLKTHLATVDAVLGSNITHYLFDREFAYAAIAESMAVLLILWLICLWLYRRKIFIRV
jgi:heparan-alpha-glucosaminide N-acetyltransferase